MGRGLLISTLTLSIILGMIQIGVQNRKLTTADINIEYFNQTHAQNLASSTLEVAVNRLNKDLNWRTNGNPWMYTALGEEVAVHVNDHSSHPTELDNYQVRIRAISEIDERTAMTETILEFESIFPPIPGAMGFYGIGSELDIRGNVDVNGFDKNPDGTDGDGEDLPAIASVINQESLIDASGQAYSLEGNPPFSEQELDAQELQDRIDEYDAVAEIYTPPDLGSTASPKIVKMPDGKTKVTDDMGAGILIIPINATLELRGDFEYHGIIIVQGTLDIAGNVKIFGSALFGDNALLEIDEPEDGDATLKGNTMVQYSSSALANVDQALAPILNKGLEFIGIFE